MQEQQPPPAPIQNGPKPRGRRKKIRTEPIRPICPQCEKQFSNQSALTKHKLTHSDERKFACQQCSKAFKRHDHLTGHMQTHSNRKPYNCTIQGCDKTYCDARSLRRHKENIHHIVTPREQQGMSIHNSSTQNNSANLMTGTSTSSIRGECVNSNHLDDSANLNITKIIEEQLDRTDMNNNGLIVDHNHSNNMNISPTFQTGTMSSATTSTEHLVDGSSVYLTNLNSVQQNTSSQQPSHLYQRRIQRLRSDSDAYGCSNNYPDLLNGRGYLACTTTSTHNLPPHTLQHGNNHNLNHQQGSFSADCTSNQHFSFDFHSVNNGQMEHAISSSNIPLSSGSIADSGLGLSAQYEQHTSGQPQEQTHSQHPNQTQDPMHQHYHQQHVTTMSSAATSTEHLVDGSSVYLTNLNSVQQNTSSQQPSHLYQRRIQRLRSDSDAYGCNNNYPDLSSSRGYLACSTTSTHNLPPHTLQHGNNHNLNHQQGSFSADCTSNQHFSFDFHSVNNGQMEHAISSSNIPLSSGSIADSGLSLNVQYEQHTSGQLQDQSHAQHPNQTQDPMHQDYHIQHHVSLSSY